MVSTSCTKFIMIVFKLQGFEFSIIQAWKSYSRPKISVFWGIWPPKCMGTSLIALTGTSAFTLQKHGSQIVIQHRATEETGLLCRPFRHHNNTRWWGISPPGHLCIRRWQSVAKAEWTLHSRYYMPDTSVSQDSTTFELLEHLNHVWHWQERAGVVTHEMQRYKMSLSAKHTGLKLNKSSCSQEKVSIQGIERKSTTHRSCICDK